MYEGRQGSAGRLAAAGLALAALLPVSACAWSARLGEKTPASITPPSSEDGSNAAQRTPDSPRAPTAGDASPAEDRYRLPLIEQFDDGSRTVAILALEVQVRAPDDVQLYSVKQDRVTLVWGDPYQRLDHVSIDRRAERLAANAKQKITELRTSLRAFTLGEVTELDNGFDLYFSYFDSSLDKQMGYYSQITVDGTAYRCYLSSGSSMDGVASARRLCRSAASMSGRDGG